MATTFMDQHYIDTARQLADVNAGDDQAVLDLYAELLGSPDAASHVLRHPAVALATLLQNRMKDLLGVIERQDMVIAGQADQIDNQETLIFNLAASAAQSDLLASKLRGDDR